MAETPVTKPLRTSIKIAARVAQVARLIELMPTPQDFATKLAGDIIYMASLIQKFQQDINKVLDGYSNIPWDYLNTQLNSAMTSANSALAKAQAYTDYIVDNTLGLAAEVTMIGSEMYETTMDITTHSAQTASSFGAAVSSTSSDILGDHETAQTIRDSVSSWTPTDGDNALKSAAASIVNAQNEASGLLDGVTDSVNETGTFIKTVIDKLKSMVDTMSKDVDDAFGGIIQSDKLTTTLTTVSDGLSGYDKALASQVVGASAEAISNIISNFSVGKFVTAFLGVVTNAVLISTGLNELPPIDFEKMLDEFQGSLNDPLKGVASDVTFDDLVEYDPQKYNDLKESFETYLIEQRTEMLSKKKNIFTAKTAEAKAYINASKNWYNGMSKEERKEIKTAIKEIKKKRDSAKNAKVSKKLKEVVLEELDKLKETCKVFSKRLKEEWEAMLKTYEDAVKQIKEFFENGGPGDQYVEDLCLDINENCDNIKQLCTVDMPTQVAGSATKAALPYCFGMAVPNYAHNVISFVVDVKIILKFIMDLLKYILNILDDIKKLAQLFLNALKKLRDIINQLLDMLGLGWFMDLVQDLINTFQDKVNDTCSTLEGTLSPVYLKDTSMYYKWVDEINSFRSSITSLGTDDGDWLVHTKNSHINGLLVMMGADPIDYEEGSSTGGYTYLSTSTSGGGTDSLGGVLPTYYTPSKRTLSGVNSSGVTKSESVWYYDRSAISKELASKLEYIKSIKDTYIVAYRSPKFKAYEGAALTKEQYVIDGSFEVNMTSDPSQVETWYYYHPNLNHLGYDIEFYNLKGNTFNYKDFTFAGMVGSDTTSNREYWTSYMSNAARVANNEWQHKTVKKLGTNYGDWGDAFNIISNNIITAYEAFYWYQDVVDGEENWTRILLPNGDYDEYYDPEDPEHTTYVDPDDDVEQTIGYEVIINDDGIPELSMFNNDDNPTYDEDTKLNVSFTISGVDWVQDITPYVYAYGDYYPINTDGGTTNIILSLDDIDGDPFDSGSITFGITHDTANGPFTDEGVIDMNEISININSLSIVDSSTKPEAYGLVTSLDDDGNVNVSLFNNGGLSIDSDDEYLSLTLDISGIDLDGVTIEIGGNTYPVNPDGTTTIITQPDSIDNLSLTINTSGSGSGDGTGDGTGSGDGSDILDNLKVEVVDMSIIEGYKNFNVKLDITNPSEIDISGKIKVDINDTEYSESFSDYGKTYSTVQSWNIDPITSDTFDITITGIRTDISSTTEIVTKWQLDNATYNGESFGTTDNYVLYLGGCEIIDKTQPVNVTVSISFDESSIASIINQSEKGSVVRIYVDTVDEEGNTVKESKLVWVKNKTLKKGDLVSVNIDGKLKYFQVF